MKIEIVMSKDELAAILDEVKEDTAVASMESCGVRLVLSKATF